VYLNTSIQPEIQPKVAEQEAKSPRKMASEAIHGQRHTFLLTAVAQARLSRDSLSLATKERATFRRLVSPGHKASNQEEHKNKQDEFNRTHREEEMQQQWQQKNNDYRRKNHGEPPDKEFVHAASIAS
jgi:hypothetical protein